jgi:hypothetical protein
MEPPTSDLLDLHITQPELSPLEQEVIEEYERLAENMKKVCHHPIHSTSPSPLALSSPSRPLSNRANHADIPP